MEKTKKELRKDIMKQRDAVDESERKAMDRLIFQNVTGFKPYQDANAIFLFVNYLSEVDTRSIILHAFAQGKTVCVPKVKSREEGLELVIIKSMEDLEQGSYGIMEPKDHCIRMAGEDLDLILMPGVAFDLSGGRIGYGGGFYDRFIQGLGKAVCKIAIAYELQILEHIPMEQHDVRIDGIITEKRVQIF